MGPIARLPAETDGQVVGHLVALYESVGMTTFRVYDIFDLGTAEAERTKPPPAT